MQSVWQALSWEYTARCWRPALAALLIGIGLPSLGYGIALLRGTPLPAEVLDMPALHFSFMLMGFICFSSVVIAALGDLSPRVFALPVATWRLVAAKMLLGSLTIGLLYLLTVELYTLLFGISWPRVGPALAMSVGVLWACATAWTLIDFRFWKLISLGLMWTGLLYWIIRSTYPDGMAEQGRLWPRLTIIQLLALAALAAGAYATAVVSVGRMRRGDADGWKLWWDRIVRWSGRLPGRRRGFSSPAGALVWFEWTTRGIALPVVMGLLTSFALMGNIVAGWYANTTGHRAVEMLCVMTFFFPPPMALLVGMFAGHRNSVGSKFEMDSFAATRPATNATVGKTLLTNALLSVLAANAVFLVFLGLTITWAWWYDGTVIPRMWDEFAAVIQARAPLNPPPVLTGVIVVAVSWLSTWTAFTLSLSLIVTGRRWFIGTVFYLVFGTFIVWVGGVQMLIPHELLPATMAIFAWLTGVACFAISAGLLWFSVRRGHAGKRLLLICAAAWLVLCAVVLGFESMWLAPPVSVLALSAGLLALPLAPFASVPLAIAWNRHR